MNSHVPGRSGRSVQEIWEDFSLSFTPAVREVVEFAKHIPGFQALSQHDQVTLLKAGTFEVHPGMARARWMAWCPMALPGAPWHCLCSMDWHGAPKHGNSGPEQGRSPMVLQCHIWELRCPWHCLMPHSTAVPHIWDLWHRAQCPCHGTVPCGSGMEPCSTAVLHKQELWHAAQCS